jgi:hypothetical protein
MLPHELALNNFAANIDRYGEARSSLSTSRGLPKPRKFILPMRQSVDAEQDRLEEIERLARKRS